MENKKCLKPPTSLPLLGYFWWPWDTAPTDTVEADSELESSSESWRAECAGGVWWLSRGDQGEISPPKMVV